MDIVQALADLFGAVIGFLNYLLGLVEQALSPITQLVERWNNLTGGGEG